MSSGDEVEDPEIVGFCLKCGHDIGGFSEPWNPCMCENIARDWMMVPGELGFALTDRMPANVALISVEDNCVVTQVSVLSDEDNPYHVFEF